MDLSVAKAVFVAEVNHPLFSSPTGLTMPVPPSPSSYSSYSSSSAADADMSSTSCGIGELARNASFRNSFRRNKREPMWIQRKFLLIFIIFHN